MNSFKKLLQNVALALLFAAALNLSLHVVFPEKHYFISESGSTLSEQSFLLVPFREKETSQNLQSYTSLQSLPFSFTSKWLPLNHNKITLELFYKSGNNHFKEYPFNILVRNLRI